MVRWRWWALFVKYLSGPLYTRRHVTYRKTEIRLCHSLTSNTGFTRRRGRKALVLSLSGEEEEERRSEHLPAACVPAYGGEAREELRLTV
jgi:hypothetical protein